MRAHRSQFIFAANRLLHFIADGDGFVHLGSAPLPMSMASRLKNQRIPYARVSLKSRRYADEQRLVGGELGVQ